MVKTPDGVTIDPRTSSTVGAVLPAMCSRCKGAKFTYANLRDLGGRQPHGFGVEHYLPCDMCDGKGYITEADRQAYRESWGIT